MARLEGHFPAEQTCRVQDWPAAIYEAIWVCRLYTAAASRYALLDASRRFSVLDLGGVRVGGHGRAKKDRSCRSARDVTTAL